MVYLDNTIIPKQGAFVKPFFIIFLLFFYPSKALNEHFYVFFSLFLSAVRISPQEKTRAAARGQSAADNRRRGATTQARAPLTAGEAGKGTGRGREGCTPSGEG